MAQQRHRANLSAANFPLSQTFFGQSVIVGRSDQNFNREIDSNADVDKDRGVPQVIYCHNVVPTGQGFQSVGFDTRIAAATPAVTDFDQFFTLRDADDNRFLFSPAAGNNYVWDSANFEWTSLPFAAEAPVTEKTLVTVAFIRGITYICYANYGVFTYNTETKVLDPVTLNGLTIENVKGICGAAGYLIVWDDVSVSWSTPTDELDFVPDITTGAGGGSVQDARGKIIACVEITNGFIVYTSKNAVGASYSANVRFPFVFKEVQGSGGIVDITKVSYGDNLGVHYAYTSVGFQVINKGEAKQSFPEVTDFLAGSIFEDFDATTFLFTTEYLTTQLNVKVNVCGDRYVVVSYGKTSLFTHALVYDITFKRWGKLRIDHVDVAPFEAPNLYGQITYDQLLSLGTLYDDLMDTSYDELWEGTWNQAPVPKQSIGFLSADGTIKTANFNIRQVGNLGAIVFGKYQYVRDHWIQFHRLEFENIQVDAVDFAVRLLPSLNGKTFVTPVSPVAVTADGLFRDFGCHTTAKNISVACTGTFYLSSMQIFFSDAGNY